MATTKVRICWFECTKFGRIKCQFNYWLILIFSVAHHYKSWTQLLPGRIWRIPSRASLNFSPSTVMTKQRNCVQNVGSMFRMAVFRLRRINSLYPPKLWVIIHYRYYFVMVGGLGVVDDERTGRNARDEKPEMRMLRWISHREIEKMCAEVIRWVSRKGVLFWRGAFWDDMVI